MRLQQGLEYLLRGARDDGGAHQQLRVTGRGGHGFTHRPHIPGQGDKALAAEGYTMVVVTHEMDFARQVSNEVVFLEKGLLIEKAPPEKFFTQPDSERVRQFLQSSR